MGIKEELARLRQQITAEKNQRAIEEKTRQSQEARLKDTRRLQNTQAEQARVQLESRMQAMDSQIDLRNQMVQARDFLNQNTHKRWKLMDIDTIGEITELTDDEYRSRYIAGRCRVKGIVLYAIARIPNGYGDEVDYIFVGRTKEDTNSFDQSDIGKYQISYGDAPIYRKTLDKRIANVVVMRNERAGRNSGGSVLNLSPSANPNDLTRQLVPAINFSI